MPDDSSNKQPPAGDDRNLVIVDEDFVNADTEDRLWLFWERNKAGIVGGSVAIIVGILGLLAYYVWNEDRKEKVGDEYTACQSNDARIAFAKKYAGKPLAALAQAEVGDELKKAQKLDEAAKAYDEASRLAGLADKSPALLALGARTRLYAALARQEAGVAGADAAIADVANDTNVPDTLRGFAMLTLANIAIAKNDPATATEWLNAMDKKLRADHVWSQDKESLVRSEPSLITPATPAAK